MGRLCQSCSIPMNKDKLGGGTEQSGAKSAEYCSLCYQDGAFVHPDFTVKEMQEFCIEQLAKQGMPRVMGWLFTRSLPKLARWKAL